MKTSALFLALGIASICVSGCHSGAPGPQAASQAENFKTYHLRGKIVSTNNATGEVTVDHEAIPGFMEAMTMPYKVHDTRMIGELHPGDIITADVLVSQNDDAEVYLDHFVIVGQSKPDYRPRVSYHVPTPGDIVPEFSLVNQDGKTIRLSRYRGKALLITFIYTRCPLPDFCPRVTRNFAAIDKALAASPSLFARTHLISASFDPEHDTSDRLKAFGQQYMGTTAPNAFAHWDFAAASRQSLPEMAKFFDLGLTNEADSTITHTLSTTLIGPDGKVVRFYPGNEWTPDEILADLKTLLK